MTSYTLNHAYAAALPVGKLIHFVNQYKDRLLAEHLSPLDITPAQIKVLMMIEVEKKHSPAEISKALSIDCGSMTRMIERLVKKQLIVKLPNPNDKRGVLVTLTPQGIEVLDQCLDVIAKQVGPALTGNLSSDEVEILLDLLKRMLPEEGYTV